jgi:uncharacterized membrane protein
MATNRTERNNKDQSSGNYQRREQKPRTPEGLPHPEILEGYDYVIKGSADRILRMFEKEQEHRHDWEKRALRVHSISTILGQILGFAIAASVFIAAIVIGMYGDASISAFIWVFGMAIIVMAGLVWTYAKSMGQRPLFARPAMRTSFRPEKQKAASEDDVNE